MNDRRTVLASVAAVAGVVAAWSCCLPVFPLLAAAGFAGAGALLAAVRPYLLVGSVLLIAFGFYQARRARNCNRRPARIATALLWFSAVVIGVTIFFPQAIADLLAG